MAAGEIQLTVIGNLTDDPEIRYTPGGHPVAKFRVATTPRVFKDGQWVDGEPSFVSCTAWRQLAENVAGSLKRGSRVVVTGTFGQRSYQTAEGEKRTVWEMQADEVAASLKFATVTVQKMARTSGGNSATPAADAWSTDSAEAPF
jgi:single-strand DNA-binding protein